MPFKVNFAAANKPIPASIYGAKVDSYKIRDDAHCHIVFRITDDNEFNGKRLVKFYQTDSDAANYLFNDLVALGADSEEISPPATPDNPDGVEVDIEPIMKQCIGASCLLRVSIRSYTDKNTNLPRDTNNIDAIEAA